MTTTASTPDWTASSSKRLQASAIGAVGVPTIWMLGHSWRWRVEGHQHLDDARARGQFPVMAFWHGRILPSIYFFRHRDIVVITSDNFDGEWIAKIIHRFGYRTSRGSTSRNAARAALKAKRLMEEGHAVGITIDGPRGPVKVAQPGAVWLAKATGNPIIPFHMEASNYWTAPSWDATQIPVPFSRVAVAIGEPFFVASDSDDAALERSRLLLEERLQGLQTRALAMVAEAK